MSRPPERPLRWIGFPGYTSHLARTYRELCRGEDELAHALYPTDTVAALRWSRRTGRPTIMSVMGIPRREGVASDRWYPWFWRRAATRAHTVTALSLPAATAFADLFGREAPDHRSGNGPRHVHPGGRAIGASAHPVHLVRDRPPQASVAGGGGRRHRPSALARLSSSTSMNPVTQNWPRPSRPPRVSSS